MADPVDVIVIGGGVIGLSCGRELRRAGIDRVLVLERASAVGEGSSSRANGGVRAQFATAANIDFSRFSIEEFERLARAYGPLLGFHQTGYLLFAGTEAGESMLRAGCDLQRRHGVETEWLSADGVMGRAPFLRPDGLRCGTFHARDGFLDPHGVVSALWKEAVAAGAEVRTRTEVLGLAADGEGFRISTSGGTLRARWVVNAAGPSAARVASMLAVDVPVEPVRRNLAYISEDRLPGLIPMCVDLDTGVLVRKEAHGGFVVAYSDPADPPGWETTVDPRFLEAVAARIGHRFPFLQAIPIDLRHCWAGLYPETPDHHAIIGVDPSTPRFVQCVGFGGHGVMHAPAAGRAVAELVAGGRCTTFDLRPLRPSRFAEGDLVVESAVL
jgi:sarcosine oxidase subunit beta